MIWRFRLVACSLVLAALSFTQRPGELVSDTKLDLVVNPEGLLARALHLWEPLSGFGQVQNQAYGYLFPLGSFFWLGDLLTLPGWVVQRLWWSLLLVTAFLGVVKLCGVLGIGNPTGRVLAGFAYALSPRILTTLGPISIEAWPSALAPWVLVPLVIGSTRGSPRRAAALSALAVAAVGGVNAAATFAVIPLGVIWLLTREPGRRRRAMMLWWPVLVLVGTAWWLVPLLLLGRYSPPFLDFIETASVTTFPATIFDALRGTSHWVPYVDGSWQAGNDLLTTGYIALNSAVLLGFGVVGLASRGNPHRLFLLAGLLGGLLAVTLGHSEGVHGWLAPAVQDLLDGPLAPLRNVHKFDPLIRLPMVLGLAHAVHLLAGRQARTGDASDPSVRAERVGQRAVVLMVAVAVVGAASPAISGRLAPANSFTEIPGYWVAAAHWLDDHAEAGTTLLAPGSSFATYQWGDPEDEPLQPLADSAWALRNAVPLAPPGNIRMLDAIESRLATGRPSAGLTDYLRRAGIGHVVLRSDLRGPPEQPEAAVVRNALIGSPGIERVASFGPSTVPSTIGWDEGTRVVSQDGWQERTSAVEVYAVQGAVQAMMTEAPPVVVGGPESLLELADVEAIDDAPTLLAADVSERPADSRLLLTDGLRRREVSFARLRGARSATLEPEDDGRLGAPAREYVLDDSERWETTARLTGIRELEASSSQAYADADVPVRPDTLPFAALDGRTETSWAPNPSDEQPWLEVRFEKPRTVGDVTVVLGSADFEGTAALRIETDDGASGWVRGRPGERVSLPSPDGRTSLLRLVVEPGTGADGVEVAELQVEGLRVERSLVLPRLPVEWGAPDVILLSATEGRRSACLEIGGDVRCGVGRERSGEETLGVDRVVRLGAGDAYGTSIAAEPVASDALLGLLQRNQLVNVAASSNAVRDARASAVAAIDGDAGTTWTADPDDPAPTMSLNWVAPRTIRGIELSLDRMALAAAATRVELRYQDGSQRVRLDSRGRADVRPFRSDRLEIELLADDGSERVLADGTREPLGPGVSEVRLDGLGLLPMRLSDVRTDIGCGFGPTLRVGEQVYATSVTASPRELFDGGILPARVCGPARIALTAGATRVVLSDAPAFRGVRVVMQTADTSPAGGTPVEVDAPSPVRRILDPVSAMGGYVAMRENSNPGWVATTNEGGRLIPVTLDGWQQGWQVPAGDAPVRARFAPDGPYRLALLGGGVLLGLLVVLTLLPRRRARSDGSPALRARRVPHGLFLGCGAAALVLVGGWWGFLAAGLSLGLSVLRRRLAPDLFVWLAAAPVVAAALVYWARPLGSEAGWGGASAVPHVLVLLSLAALLAVPGGHEDRAATSSTASRPSGGRSRRQSANPAG